MRLGIYDPAEHTLIVGTRKISGFAEGTMIEFVPNNAKLMSAKVGARGEYSILKNRNRSGMINVNLDPESESNIYLNSLVGAESIFPVYIQRNGETVRDILTAPEGWIEERPDFSADDTGPTRTWGIGAGSVQQIPQAV